MNQIIYKIIESWANKKGNICTLDDILKWVDFIDRTTKVKISECSIDDSTFWFHDKVSGEIVNRKKSFFSIKGLQRFENSELIIEQPIINQPEIGYLGIICKEIDGVLNFLMHAKIEPGNVNCIQISPTIQATKSNFTRCHGGKYPPYLSYFENSHKYNVIMDQIQSEQASRFYMKRNRNMIIEVRDEIEVLPNFKWMTLGQLKELMKIENLVNMDTRTVISGIPLSTIQFTDEQLKCIRYKFTDDSFYQSIFHGNINESIVQIYQYVNNYKMFHDVKTVLVPLGHLISWKITSDEIICKHPANFSVKFYDISIEGREVQNWQQPLFRASRVATFGLLTCVENGKRKYLVRATPEVGSFDKIELGPSVMLETKHSNFNVVEKLFKERLQNSESILTNVVLSEEGGRFYHEQNRNVIVEVDRKVLNNLPAGYFLVDYCTLNYLIQINNCLNIQLRNLLSLLEV